MGRAEPVRWGLLSTARINRRIEEAIAASPLCEVLAVASRDGGRASEYARSHGIPRAHAGYEALLADPDIEAVYVSLPNGLHPEWALRALQAGKHVLCEKPLSARAGEAASLFDAAERAGRLLSEGFMYRHHPQTRRLAELVRGGAIGSPRLIRASFSFPLGDPHDVRLSATLQGGALLDVGCYCVDAARLIAGEPVRVSGWRAIGGDGVDVRFAGTLEHLDGVIAQFDAGIRLAPRQGLEIVGDEASLHVPDPWLCNEPGIELRRGGRAEVIPVPGADPYLLEVEDIATAIRGGLSPLLGRTEAVSQARTIEALREAAETGTPVRIQPAAPPAMI